MKALFLRVLLAALVLCGCAAPTQPPSSPPVLKPAASATEKTAVAPPVAVSAAAPAAAKAVAPAAATASSLTVGLYPYVPNLQQFQTALVAQWAKVQPNVTLNFLSPDAWDGGYDKDPPPQADVVVFDATYFEYFRSRGYLEPLAASEIQNLSDFLPYAIAGVQVGAQYYAIPQLGCADLLIYNRNDAALAAANTLTQVKQALGQCTYTSQIPPDTRGLLVDLSGGTTDATLYLDTTHSVNGQYPFVLPPTPAQLNPTSIGNLRQVLSTGSYENATRPVDNQPYIYARWFSNGWGRAYVGYSESMAFMTPAARSTVAFKPMPWSDTPGVRPLFYADVIGINTTVSQRGTRALAVQLANVMASTETMLRSLVVGTEPQYLFPTRPSIFAALRTTYPIYGQMQDLVQSSNPLMFKVNEQSRAWFTSMKTPIKVEILSNTVCGCDYPAEQTIFNNSTAAGICNTTCSTHGGWNGQWTNQYPAAQTGSACGCNTCPLPR